MVRVAERQARARDGASGRPRPTFVLGLEEQLRTDLRLGPARLPARRLGWRGWVGATLVTVAALGGALVAVERADPGAALAALQAPWRAVSAAIAPSPDRRVAWYLQAGWRHLGEVHALVVERQPVPWSLLDALQADYTEALRLAEASGDDRLVQRVVREATDVGEDLTALAPQAGASGPVLAAAGTALVAATERRIPVAVIGRPAPVASPTPGPTATVLSLVAATATALPTTTAPPPPVATSAPTLTPVRATATLVQPSATPTVDAPPPTRERWRTATPSPPPPPPTATPPMVAPTPTSDDWPTATPPKPPPTVAPEPSGEPSVTP
jgi:hypothetical protein